MQHLEAALRRLKADNSGPRKVTAPPGAVRPNEAGARGGGRAAAFEPAESPNAPGAPRVLGSVPPQPPPLMSRRSDAFDPMDNPNAPGAPRVLGSIPPQPAPMMPPQRGIGAEPAPYGAAAGAGAAVDPGYGRFPAAG